MIPKVEKLLTDHGVSLHIDPFVDPDLAFEYTPEEMAVLSRYLTTDRRDPDGSPRLRRLRTQGVLGGPNYINIMPDGTVLRCAAVTTTTIAR